MDYSDSGLNFQKDRLNYEFKNFGLLLQALTDKNSKLRVCQNNDRLRVLGESVLKLVACQYAIMTCDVTKGTNEGDWTEWRNSMLMDIKQDQIGRTLLTKYFEEDEFLEFVASSLYTGTKYYSKFVKALFGAVFLDSSGVSTGVGVLTCMHLFEFLWSDMGYLPNVEKHSLQLPFEPPNTEVKKYWNEHGLYENSFIHDLTVQKIGVKVENPDYLREAMIHKSFYKSMKVFNVMNLLKQPNYQALEFLGDGLLGVIVSEHFCRTHLDWDRRTYVDQITALVNNDSLRKVYSKLQLEKWVKIDKSLLGEWKGGCDIVEAIIGALYVDGGMWKPKKFILEIFDLGTPTRIKIRDVAHLRQLLDKSWEDKMKQVRDEEEVEKRFISNKLYHFEGESLEFTAIPESRSYSGYQTERGIIQNTCFARSPTPRVGKTWNEILKEDDLRRQSSPTSVHDNTDSFNLIDVLIYAFNFILFVFIVVIMMLMLSNDYPLLLIQ